MVIHKEFIGGEFPANVYSGGFIGRSKRRNSD
jgi:hypothetical protein